ncbi:MAG: hypothetical protein ACOC44_10650 [Promethearchaeia archaeon]
MTEEKNVASVRLAIKIKDDYLWIGSTDLYELGKFGEWMLC